MIQTLEKRCLFAVTLTDGLLSLIGTAGNDSFRVDLQSGTVTVLEGSSVRSFPASQVQRIYAYGSGGNDYIRISRLSVPAKLEGGSGNDTLYGGPGNDEIYGMYGDDVLRAGMGTDVISGGMGIDHVTYDERSAFMRVSLDNTYNDGESIEHDNVWTDVEVVTGGMGNDWIIGSANSDQLNGFGGDDTIWGNAGLDTINGGLGDDQIIGGNDADWLDGKNGDDTIWGGEGADSIFGGSNNDLLMGEGGNDRIDGQSGADEMRGGPGIDTVDYSTRTSPVTVKIDDIALDGQLAEGDNVMIDVENLITGIGNDYLVGSAAANAFAAGEGNDTIFGGTGNDSLSGMGGNDQIWGELDNDFLVGGQGNDGINGGFGNDKLFGHAGSDFLDGWDGNDTLDGGMGDADTVIGGNGHDSAKNDPNDWRSSIEILLA